MKPVIYVDVLLAVNLLLTYVLVTLTCLIMKIYVKKTRILAGAIVGAVFSLTVLLPDLGFLLSVVLKSVMCFSITGIVFRCRSFRQFLKCSLFFIIVNALLAGMILLLHNSPLKPILMYRNMNVYCNINLPVLLILTAICYIILRYIFSLLNRTERSQTYSVQIYLDDMYVECSAIIDSGNSLTEPISGDAVNVVACSVIKPVVPSGVYSFLCGDFSITEVTDHVWLRRLCLVPASFAKGESVLPAIRIDKMIVDDGKYKKMLKKCIVAVTPNEFDSNLYKMLLHPHVLQEINSIREESANEIEFA